MQKEQRSLADIVLDELGARVGTLTKDLAIRTGEVSILQQEIHRLNEELATVRAQVESCHVVED